jgi:lysophospholipase L1-like esterase
MARPGSVIWVYAGLLALGYGVARIVWPGHPKVRSGMKVLLLGDSLAQGLSLPLSAIAKEAQVEFKTMAKAGTGTADWSANSALVQLLETYRPGLTLVSLGITDEKMQESNLKALLALLKQYGDVGWISPPRGVSAVVEANVPQSHIFRTSNYDLPYGPDRLHPTIRGYAGWAAEIWKWLS